MARPLPLSGFLDRAYGDIDQAARRVLGPRGREIVMGTQHERLLDAVLADVVDVVPLVGDFSNAMRVQDAAQHSEDFRKKRLPMQILDLVGGALPDPVGGIFDALTPSNTIAFFEHRGVSPQDVPRYLLEGG